jgi:hypothetical protein
MDLKDILEERILDAKIEFTLREALSIAKKDFYELIFYVIKKKRQLTIETVMARALDTCILRMKRRRLARCLL